MQLTAHIFFVLCLLCPRAFAANAVACSELARLSSDRPTAEIPTGQPTRAVAQVDQKSEKPPSAPQVRNPEGGRTDGLAEAYENIFKFTEESAAVQLLRDLRASHEIALDELANIEGMFLARFGYVPSLVPGVAEKRVSPEQWAQKEPDLDTIVEIAEMLSHGQKLFDRRSDLRALIQMVRDGTDSGLGGKHEGYWATHGLAHAINIAVTAVKLQNAIRASGGGKIYEDAELQAAHDSQVKWIASIFGGLAHDSGMDSPSPGTNKALREDHWRVIGHLAYGARVPGLEVSQRLVEKFVETLVHQKENPLNSLLRENAVANLLFKNAGAIPNEAQVRQAIQAGRFSEEALQAEMRVLAKELFLVGYSHGSDEITGFDPSMGIQHLAQRRSAYLEELQRGMERSPEAKADLAGHYPNDPRFSTFMTWASKEAENLPDTHPMRRLAHAFNTSEGLLNAADANRSRGGARLFGANGTQVIPYWYEPVLGATDARGNVAGWRAHAVLFDARTGDKLLIDVGDRVAAGTFVRDIDVEKRPDGATVFHTAVYPPRTSNEASLRSAATMAGRIVGETSAYMWRGMGESFAGKPGSKPFAHELPRVLVDFPGKPSSVDAEGKKIEGSNPVFEAALAEQITDNMARVLARNEMLPPEIQAKVVKKEVPGKKPGTMEVKYVVSDPTVKAYVRRLWSFNQVDAPPQIADVNSIRRNMLPEGERQFSRSGTAVTADDGSKLSKKVVVLGEKERANYTRDLIRGGAFGGERQIRVGNIEGAQIFQTVRPEMLLQDAYEMTIGNDSDQGKVVTLIRRDGGPGNIYLLKNVNGDVIPDSSTGQGPIPISASKESLSILGATIYVRNEEEFQQGRSATVRVFVPAHSKISVVVVPPRTAYDHWNAEMLATPIERVAEQAEAMATGVFPKP